MLLAPLLALLASLPQTPPVAAPDPSAYPPQRNASLLRFFSVEGEIKAEALRKALKDLGTGEVEARMAYGPLTTGSRPGRYFFAVEVPATLKESEVVKALRKGAATVEVVAWTAFEGEALELPGGGLGGEGFMGMSPRDWVLGSSNDLRWVDMLRGRFQYYALPEKLDAATIKDRMVKLLQPFGRASALREVERGVLSWQLVLPIEEALAKKVEKALAKLDGVTQARLDAKSGLLQAQFTLEDLHASAPPSPRPPPAGAADAAPAAEADPAKALAPRARFDVNPVLDLLAKEKLTVAPAAGAAPAPEAEPEPAPDKPLGG